MSKPLNCVTGLPSADCSASSIREKVEAERWFFIAAWCKERGVSPMVADNFNRAAMEWAKRNCFGPNSEDRYATNIFDPEGD
jgi:hypothetical protein